MPQTSNLSSALPPGQQERNYARSGNQAKGVCRIRLAPRNPELQYNTFHALNSTLRIQKSICTNRTSIASNATLSDTSLPGLHVYIMINLVRISGVITIIAVAVSSCTDPYRKKDITVTDSAIVIEANTVTADDVYEENPGLKKAEYFNKAVRVFTDFAWGTVDSSTFASVNEKYEGLRRAILRNRSGEKILMYHPDPGLKVGDCIDFLTVDGRDTVAYSIECEPGLLRIN